MMMYFDFNAEVAAFFIGNFSENLELYVQGGDIKKVRAGLGVGAIPYS